MSYVEICDDTIFLYGEASLAGSKWEFRMCSYIAVHHSIKKERFYWKNGNHVSLNAKFTATNRFNTELPSPQVAPGVFLPDDLAQSTLYLFEIRPPFWVLIPAALNKSTQLTHTHRDSIRYKLNTHGTLYDEKREGHVYLLLSLSRCLNVKIWPEEGAEVWKLHSVHLLWRESDHESK